MYMVQLLIKNYHLDENNWKTLCIKYNYLDAEDFLLTYRYNNPGTTVRMKKG